MVAVPKMIIRPALRSSVGEKEAGPVGIDRMNEQRQSIGNTSPVRRRASRRWPLAP
jgi:hypothetical protein